MNEALGRSNCAGYPKTRVDGEMGNTGLGKISLWGVMGLRIIVMMLSIPLQ